MIERLNKGLIVIACVVICHLLSFHSYGQTTKTYYKVELVIDQMDELKPLTQRLKRKYPDVECRTTYNAPNFLVAIGNCGSKKEARRLKKRLDSEFPNLRIVECSRIREK